MAFYDYICSHCGLCKNVIHPMSEIDNGFSEETLSQIVCKGNECLSDSKQIGLEFKRAITAPTIKTKTLTPQEVQKERKNRSHDHFKKEVLPYLGKDELAHHAKKGVKPT